MCVKPNISNTDGRIPSRCSVSSILLRAPGLDPLDGVAGEGWGVAELEFFFDVLAMDFDGLHAEVKLLSDLAGAFALADELENFEFAVGQLLNGRTG